MASLIEFGTVCTLSLVPFAIVGGVAAWCVGQTWWVGALVGAFFGPGWPMLGMASVVLWDLIKAEESAQRAGCGVALLGVGLSVVLCALIGVFLSYLFQLFSLGSVEFSAEPNKTRGNVKPNEIGRV